ncbi:MAG: hydrogenase expression/formation protein HypE [Firmicutes bacterium]|nr:hydrogenase expression/formation protein HypE [Bacillota bacterium]
MPTHIRLAEGGGGAASANLIQQVFWTRFQNPELKKGNDAAVLDFPGGKLAFTTDSFVITPWNFPGGDIGKLAVCGTINDLTMMGGAPLGLAVSFIIEEGFPTASLELIAGSLADTARKAGAPVVTGDTKVVNRGAADGIFITTSGVGLIEAGVCLGGGQAKPGDRVIVTGSIGDHGAAILLARGELGITGDLKSDVAPLNLLLLPLIRQYTGRIHVLRDPTRGGLAAALNEIARQSRLSIRLSENLIPIKPEVQGITTLLGIDPLYLANEGKAIIIAAADCAGEIVAWLRRQDLGTEAAIIGEVLAGHPGIVSISNQMGGERILTLGSGEQLPRIC